MAKDIKQEQFRTILRAVNLRCVPICVDHYVSLLVESERCLRCDHTPIVPMGLEIGQRLTGIQLSLSLSVYLYACQGNDDDDDG